MNRAHAFVLGAWFALLGVDRVNLFEGMAFLVTPFLALTPLVIVSEWIRRSLAGSRLTLSRETGQYAIVAVALVAVVWASVAIGQAPAYSARRATLLTAQVVATLAVVVLTADRAGFLALLGRASVIAVAMHYVAAAAQIGTILGDVPTTLELGFATVWLEPYVYGIVPRFSGLVADPTRAGWALIVLGWFIAIGERNDVLRRVAIAAVAIALVATLSRSALLGAATMLGLVALTRRKWQLPSRSIVAGGVFAAILGGALFALPAGPVRVVDALEPLAGRFSVSEASASEHILLIERGLDEATSSVPRFAVGLGYGNSFLVLQDRFPGNPYGNFHSLYVAMLVESGIVSLLCVVILVGWPVVRGGSWRPLIAAAAVLNVFYQTNAEPTFWFVLALAWTATALPAPRTPPTG